MHSNLSYEMPLLTGVVSDVFTTEHTGSVGACQICGDGTEFMGKVSNHEFMMVNMDSLAERYVESKLLPEMLSL